MTVSAVTPSVLYQGDGLTTVFPFAFPMDETSSLEVVFVDRVTHQITPVSPADYTTTITSVGGTVTFLVAPSATDNVIIARSTDTTQLVSVAAQAAYNPQVVEAVWDKLTMLVQEALTKVAGTVPVPPGLDRETFYNDLLAAYLEAAAARDKAQEWAENPEDVEVELGEYSALHHAEKAAASALAAYNSGVDGANAVFASLQATVQVVGQSDPADVSFDSDTKTLAFDLPATGMQGSLNLSDLADAAAARVNLGLGTAATVDHGTDPGEVPLNSDLGSMATEDAGDYVTKASKATQGQAEGGTTGDVWMDDIRVRQAIAQWAIGVGQTWVDVTASRTSGVSYQNTTGRSIMVITHGSGAASLQVSNDGENWMVLGNWANNYYQRQSMIVPPSWYYRRSGSGGAWMELR